MFQEALTFDDVLLVPQHSTISSRNECNTLTDLGKGVILSKPFISANMKTITGPRMAAKMIELGAMGILHRFSSIEDQVLMYREALNIYGDQSIARNHVGVSVGIKSKSDTDRLVSETGAKIVCVDVAHGDHIDSIDMINHIAGKFPEVLLIAGNVATGSGTIRLADAGANVVKCGIGSGSLCSTRTETGNGVPQLTAIMDSYSVLSKSSTYKDVKLISDGGVKTAGNAVKALCFSHAVMLGSMFSATDQTPGDTIKVNGVNCKLYAGSSTHKSTHIEGVSGYVQTKGSVELVMNSLIDGLTSGMSYQSARTLEELRDNPQFYKITNSGLFESNPHQSFVK